ncbi:MULTISPECIES: tetratricopeptide repeat protein [Azospirillum]|uniref:Tetratricopeptide repeat protein n=1 Tax=Azospirillum lipoferum TaxID=193 RepID=A0A5A9GDL3_AZOLI|nr:MULTISPECIES: tetratricopeptide repeat protein [Azospirillum]KAA0592588.1 tetratricopeptide repeat protein [Azospirillum lipoferum]MDW5532747.1 tetratricopeptide repeat protein [Azospirillum sp. NL1]
MSTVDWFAEALRHHQAGALDAAEPLYRRVLEAQPRHADALHLLGVLNHQRNNNLQAIVFIDKAIEMAPEVADYHANLGIVLQRMERLDEAEAAQRRALDRDPTHVGAHFNLGLVLAALGRLAEAADHYAEAARLSPDLADAHLNLGAVLQDLGRAEEALAAHARAAELLPGDPRPWTNRAVSLRQLGRMADAAHALHMAATLGNGTADSAALSALAAALQAAGRTEEAAERFADALRLDPHDSFSLNGLGLCLKALGQLDDAATCFDAATAIQPGHADALDNLGSVRTAQGRHAEAEALHRSAIGHRPDFAGAWNNLGNARHAAGRTGDAWRAWHVALSLDPALPETHTNLGNALRSAERFSEAERSQRRAIRLAPLEAPARNNLGHLRQGRHDYSGAADGYRSALALDPAYGEAWSNLGLARQRLGESEGAERCYDRALSLRPDLSLSHFNKGLLRLEAGDLDRGWPGYAWRFGSGQVGQGRHPRAQPWRGEDLTGRRLMIWGEQGVGDTILFSALCPELAGRAVSTILEVDRRLVPLFARSFPALRVRAEALDGQGQEAMAIPDYDRHVPMGSLPRVLRRRLADFPARQSWLVPDAGLAERWRDRLAALCPGLRVGIGWRSQMMTAERRVAYLPLDAWAPLFALPGIRWVVLQYGEVEEEVRQAERRFGIRLHRWDDLDRKDDFDGMAALIAGLDLVISPAMSVGELAGALGTPVWRFGTRDWTQLGAGVRPWYPSMRLFQPRPGEPLSTTMADMAHALKSLSTPRIPSPPGEREILPNGERLAAQAIALHRQGRLSEAEILHRKAVASAPTQPAPWTNGGLTLLRLGRIEAAIHWHRRAVALTPAFPEAWSNLGVALQVESTVAEAARAHRRAVRLRPTQAESWGNLAAALLTAHRFTEAETACSRATALAPALAGVLTTGGAVLKAQGRFADAARRCRRSLRIVPISAKGWSNLGMALAGLGRWADALHAHRRATALAPDLPDVLVNHGHTLLMRGERASAALFAERTLRLAPGRAEARMNRALLRLADGDLSGGWEDYAHRFATGDAVPRRFNIPDWQGEPLADRCILVWGEQGLGDEILFGTALPDLLRHAGKVIVECDPRLTSLFARALPRADVRAPTPDPRDADCHAAMGSVAARLRSSLRQFLAKTPFLTPDPERAAEWCTQLASLGTGLRVGVCWRSSRMTADRTGAYSRIDQWGPVFAVPGVIFVSLQYDEREAERTEALHRFGTVLHHWPDLDQRNDLDGVAGLMTGLDLVISAPTAVGELAAALGVPVWRIAAAGDWSALGAAIRPWFPTMALIGDSGDHDAALAAVARRLRRLADDRSRLE